VNDIHGSISRIRCWRQRPLALAVVPGASCFSNRNQHRLSSGTAGKARGCSLAQAGFGAEAPITDRPLLALYSPAQGQSVNTLTLDEAVRLALAQASTFQQAQLAELIAAEDVRQARVAFLPRAAGSLAHLYNSPARGPHPEGAPREMSFISADAITKFEALAGVTGELDVAGRFAQRSGET
jgi:outer membrane protein TolC